MEVIRDAIIDTLAAENPMTVRQVFYALTTQGVIAKTEAEYKNTVCRLLAEMRRSGEIPYEWLADATRWMRKPTTYSSAEQALRNVASTYRQALWDGHTNRVEIWLEKEALAGVLVDVTHEWDVPLMVTRGYPSMSFLHSAAEAIKARDGEGQRTHIYYFGDRDPSGVDIDRAIVHGIGESLDGIERANWSTPEIVAYESMKSALEGLPDFARQVRRGGEDCFRNDGWPCGTEARGACELREGCRARWMQEAFEDYATFTRVGVTEEQIEQWELPSRPTKKTDSRSKGFEGESVELDAIPSRTLRELAEECITAHVDAHQLKVLQTCEAEERRLLLEMAENFNGSSA